MEIKKFFKTKRVNLKRETEKLCSELLRIKKQENKVQALVDFIQLTESSEIKRLKKLSSEIFGEKKRKLEKMIKRIEMSSASVIYYPKLKAKKIAEKIFIGDIYNTTTSCSWILEHENSLKKEKHERVFINQTQASLWYLFQQEADLVVSGIPLFL